MTTIAIDTATKPESFVFFRKGVSGAVWPLVNSNTHVTYWFSREKMGASEGVLELKQPWQVYHTTSFSSVFIMKLSTRQNAANRPSAFSLPSSIGLSIHYGMFPVLYC